MSINTPPEGGISRCHLGEQYEKMSKNNEDGGKIKEKIKVKSIHIPVLKGLKKRQKCQ